MREKGKSGFIKGAFIIALGGFIAKLIGAFYRIPLTNLIGGHGIGLYQLVYPIYCLLLTVSATGIPSSIAKLTAERLAKGETAKPLFKKAMLLFLSIGIAGTVIMFLFAPLLAKAQGSQEVLFGYYALAPSVFLVSAISVYRGYFQGKNNMLPTALSEITEQAVKVGFGLLFAYLYRSNIQKAVVFLLLSVTISELAALFLMFLLSKTKKNKEKSQKQVGRVAMKSILRLSIPVTFSAMLLPASTLLDSVLVPKLLGVYSADPIALFGLFSGGAVTIIGLPVSICYGIAAASVPSVTLAATQGTSVRKRIFFALLITTIVSLPCVFGLYYFAEPAVKIVYRSLQGEELNVLVKLIKICSVSAFLLSSVQTLSACLTAQGKPSRAAISMLIAVVVKTLTYIYLLKSPQNSVFGMAHATNLCYLVAFLLDLLYNLRVSKAKKGVRL